MREMKDSNIGWIGKVPQHWDIAYLSSLLSERKNKNTGLIENNLLSLSYGNVKRKDITTNEGLLPESFEGYNIIEKDDIVLRLTDLQNDHRSLRTGLCKERGIITSAYCTLKRNSPNTDARYLQYYLHSFDIAKGFYGMGAGVRQGLNFDGIRKIEMLVPPLPEQKKIADSIDSETAKVDALIANQEAQIEKLKAYKQSLITEVVTKGLNPDVPMKDSGIEWIGNINSRYALKKIKHFISDYKAGPFGSSLITGNLLTTGAILVYTPEHIANQSTDNPKNLYLQEERRAEMEQFFVHEGNIIFPIVGSLGRAMYITADMPEGIINQRLAKFKIDESMVDKNYFLYLFARSDFYKTFLDVNSRGAIIVNLTKEIVYNMPFVMPPIDEQKEIVDYLDEKCAYIEKLISIKQQKIEKLIKYKKSLIYEYVTGKKEVI